MSVTTHAPKQLNASASIHPETLGQAKSGGHMAGIVRS